MSVILTKFHLLPPNATSSLLKEAKNGLLTFLIFILLLTRVRVDPCIIEGRYVNIGRLVPVLNHGLAFANTVLGSVRVQRCHIDGLILIRAPVSIFLFVVDDGDLIINRRLFLCGAEGVRGLHP